MSELLDRIRQNLYTEEEEFEEDDFIYGEKELDENSVCCNLNEDGFCETGAECDSVEVGDDCPYVETFCFKECCAFSPISEKINDDFGIS